MGCTSSQPGTAGGGLSGSLKHSNTKPPPVNAGERTDGPRDVTCHICGRKYLVHSINIHIPQCQKLWNERQEQVPKSQRKPVPKLPKGVSRMNLEDRNRVAQQVYDDHALEACPFCSRTFVPESLEKHLPSCARQHNQEWPPPPKAKPPPTGEAKNTRICHICGRKYTTHSIDIHVPQCQRLWEQRQERLPESQRKPVPTMPQKFRQSRYNSVARKVYEKNTLVECPTCGRTFLPDRLTVHQPSCERNHAKKLQGAANPKKPKGI